MKRIIKWAGLALAALLAAFGMFVASNFIGGEPLVDGLTLPGDATLVKDGFVAAYIVPAGDKQVALIDCGNDANAAALLEALAKRGLGKDAVRAIFLSHGHADHTAGCHVFANARVYAFAGEVGLAGGTENKQVKVTDVLQDGDVEQIGTLTVHAFHTPGHTAGSAVYAANGVLYLGDSATGKTGARLLPAVGMFSDDQRQNIASLMALAKRIANEQPPVQTLAFAHSGPFQSTSPLLAFVAAQR